METIEKYSTRLKEHRLLYNQFQLLLELSVSKNIKGQELINYCNANNFFNTRTRKRNRILSSLLSNRVGAFDNELTTIYQDTDSHTRRIMTLYAIIKTDRLFREFMYEKTRAHILDKNPRISNVELEEYLDFKALQSKEISEWKETTKIEIYKAFRNVLVDSGMAKRMGHSIHLEQPTVDKLFIDYLKYNNEQFFLDCLRGG
ncbi:MAG: hypothetical protein FD133_369 [Erysipelotrichaceae bacterium]|nr:MAG: hypothetical protein FD133_369 [Erysipelotrichaceae bacterium]